MRDSFTIYRNTLEALESLPPDIAMFVLSYIGHYSMDGIEPDNTNMIAYAFFCQIKPLIDNAKRKAENGQKGGKPKMTDEEDNSNNLNKPNDNLTKPNDNLTKPNNNLTKPKEEIRKEKREKENNNTLSGKPSAEYPYKAVLDYLNEKAGTAFKDQSKDSRKHIKARFDDGFSFEDFKLVIDKKTAEWAGTDMAKYLRPATLFGTKFESYLNQQDAKRPETTANRFNNFQQRNYDFDDLERKLTGRVT